MARHLHERLAGIVGDGNVLTSPADREPFERDWTGRFVGSAGAVVRPGTTAEVSALLRLCDEERIAVVPQGGNTGLVGGAVPHDDAIVLSMLRMRRILDVDASAGQLTAEAGATIADVHAAAAGAGWAYGVDFGARGSATVGGSIATNAGGINVLRHGDTRAQLLGVTAVFADGSTISHLGGLLKDNTGYHLPSLLCGSEGTLAVVTAARLRLVPATADRVTALVGFTSTTDAIVAAGILRRRLPTLDALELCLADGLELVGSVIGATPPTRAAAVLLIECSAHDDPQPALAAAIEALEAVDSATATNDTTGATGAIHVDGVHVATDPARRESLWRWRERHTESVASLGPVHKYDVTLPSATMAPFVDEVRALVRSLCAPARVWIYGHVADGNLHVNVTGVPVTDLPIGVELDGAVLGLVAARGGSISAEHGIGRHKRDWLHLARSDTELRVMRALKAAVDPHGILNPGVLLPPER